ncbi:MAG: ice-binding family protein [Patescibacteria group bacterium]
MTAKATPTLFLSFQASSTLVTASSSTVALINGTQACNVFWQVTSSATLGTSSSFIGTIMALTSIGLNTSATLQGRALARNAAVTLDKNTITKPTCASASTSTTDTSKTGLPDTGVGATKNSNFWQIALLAGLTAVLVSYYLVRRKKTN